MGRGSEGLCVHTQAVLTQPLPSSITFAGGPGRDGIIDFTPGSELLITKAKNGHLAVVSGTCRQHLLPWGGASCGEGFLTIAWVPYHPLRAIDH